MCDKNKRREKNSVELADVFRLHGQTYKANHTLTPQQHKVINAILNCRTSVLGGHIDQCDCCGATHNSYNSCRNRHCPKCQSLKTARWLQERQKELLPATYFHVVFTLPHELNTLILYNKKELYSLLFQSAWKTIDLLGEDEKKLNGLMGMISILHTWSQNLLNHNHAHCIVPGGALTKNNKWNSSKKNYLFPVKVMSKLFRGFYVSGLRKLYEENKLNIPAGFDSKTDLKIKGNFDALLNVLMKKEWVVYAKKPFAGPKKLLDYLGRYANKIAISNNRILSVNDEAITFNWRDYSDHNKNKIMKLRPEEFIRRFLSHVIPKGFIRIRFFGFLASACKKKNVEIIRKALSYYPKKAKEKAEKIDIKSLMEKLTGVDISICPTCKKGKLHRIETMPSKFKRTKIDTS